MSGSHLHMLTLNSSNTSSDDGVASITQCPTAPGESSTCKLVPSATFQSFESLVVEFTSGQNPATSHYVSPIYNGLVALFLY